MSKVFIKYRKLAQVIKLLLIINYLKNIKRSIRNILLLIFIYYIIL